MAERKKATKAKEEAEKVEEAKEVKEVQDAKPAKRSKIKPVLDASTRTLLEKRKEKYEVQPEFKRGEWFRYKKLGEAWRRPRAVSNKMRMNRKYRPPKVRIGYGKPTPVRGYHPSGFRERMVYSVRDLEGMNPKVEAARIGGSVGTRKRRTIVQAADQKGIRVLNRGVM